MKIISLILAVFFFTSCTNFQKISNKNSNPIKVLIKKENNFKEGLKTIFRDCFEFKNLRNLILIKGYVKNI